LTESVIEELLAGLNAVDHGVLEVWVGVHSNEIGRIDDSLVGTVDPSSPGVNMTDLNIPTWRSGRDCSLYLANVRSQGGWVSAISRVGSDTCWRDTVEIFASNGNASNKGCELLSPLGDGGVQGGDLGVESSLSTGSPKTKEQSGILCNGSGNGLCRFVG
jgi:hypothetical protein